MLGYLYPKSSFWKKDTTEFRARNRYTKKARREAGFEKLPVKSGQRRRRKKANAPKPIRLRRAVEGSGTTVPVMLMLSKVAVAGP
jgi:hypothetical protein